MPHSDSEQTQLSTRAGSAKESMRREFKIERKVSLLHVLWSLGLSLFVLIGLILFLGSTLKARAEKLNSSGGEAAAASREVLPQSGELVTVTDASSLWRHGLAPLGDIIEGTRLYPEVNLSFEKMPQARSGAIRLLLYDNLGNIRGDPLNLDVEQGLIVDGTSLVNQVFFQGSDGLLDETVVIVQLLNAEARWSLKVFEGPFKRADFEDFTLVAEIPISSQVVGKASN